jgi:hypothetical protein
MAPKEKDGLAETNGAEKVNKIANVFLGNSLRKTTVPQNCFIFKNKG